jgi:choline dehydrogenase-like flavoprotein
LLGDFSGSRTYSVWVKAEELPNIASTISSSSDEFGFHKTIYDHKVSFESRKQFLKALIKLQTELSVNSIADFVIDAEVMNGESSIFRAVNWHPMGTLRMGRSPSNSICDSDLKIFGTEGVYVIDASVFPRGSNGNPTFTAIALTLRLAEKLKSDFITEGNDKETP